MEFPVGFLGLTKIGNTITPTLNTQIGATTINIDSNDMKKIYTLSSINNFPILSHAYLYLKMKIYLKYPKILSKKKINIKKYKFLKILSYLITKKINV